MQNRQLERDAHSISSKVANTVQDLIQEIEQLEQLLKDKEAENLILRDKIYEYENR